jgi:phospholipid/cholesterol/gamma-HCH transport system substrate-binding protein
MTTTASFRPATRYATYAVVLLVVVVVLTSLRGGGDSDRLMVVAHFKDASPLLVGNDVRLHGVKVGQVSSIAVAGTGADVGLELDATALPVHRDATATIKPVSLLGERYVDLNSGSAKAPVMTDGGQLGLAQTGQAVELDEVLGALDQPTSDALAGMVGALGNGLDGNGKAAAAAIAKLAPSMADTTKMAKVLADQNATLSSLVTSMDRVSSGLAVDQGAAIDHLVDSADKLTGATGDNEAAFRQVLRELPGSLASARRTLDELRGTADAATPTLAALRPTTSQLPGLSKDLLAFSRAAKPALHDLNPVLDKADDLLAEARPVASYLRRQSDATSRDAASLDSLTATLAPNFRTVMDFVKGWALATNGRDGIGHYFRGNLVLTPSTVTGPLPAGASTSGILSGPLSPSGLLGTASGLVGGLLAPGTTSGGGVTGLSPTQESNVLSKLLGGL